VQPAAVGEVLRDAYAKDRGLVPRLCLIAPASRMGSRKLHATEVPAHLREWWGVTLRRLLDLRWPGRVVLFANGPTRHAEGPHVMRLSPDARAPFDDLCADLESRIGEGGDLRPVCGYVSKLPGVVARIALALEAMQDPAAPCVRGETMRAAVAWASWLLAHFRAVLGDAAESDETKLARKVLAWFKRQAQSEASARDIHRSFGHGSGLRMEELEPALDLLVESEWLRELPLPPTKPQGGKPSSPRYAVNPAALA